MMKWFNGGRHKWEARPDFGMESSRKVLFHMRTDPIEQDKTEENDQVSHSKHFDEDGDFATLANRI